MRSPLSELSLDKFIPSEHRTSLKRPLSPGTALLSPTKRRILSSEGLYSPDKKKQYTPPGLLFSDLVDTPPSPARKLDFAVLNHPSPRKTSAKHERDASPRPETPVSRSNGTPKLQPSPTIASNSSSDASARGSRVPSLDLPRDYLDAAPMLIPREMPTFADRQSIHWPGFDVHADSHILIPTSDSVSRSFNTVEDSEVDDVKENVRPRKRAKRTAVDDGKTTKLCKIEKAEKCTQDSENILTFSLTPSPIQKVEPREKVQERRRMRRMMELELDDEEDVDNQL